MDTPRKIAKKRTEVLASRLSCYDRTVAGLQKELKTHVKNHVSGSIKNKNFADTLGTVGRLEYSADLKETLGTVSTCFREIANSRLELLGDGGKGGDQLLKRLADARSGVIEPTKALLKDRDNVVSLCTKEEKKVRKK